MSLLGNQNNDFEKKLKKHLGDTEYKPAESLWDRIEQEVNKPDFEQKVEGKIGRYELAPKPETWEYIEAHLPPEPKSWKRAGKIWYSLIALLFITGALIGYQLSNESAEELAQVQETGNTTLPSIETTEEQKQPGTRNAVSEIIQSPSQQPVVATDKLRVQTEVEIQPVSTSPVSTDLKKPVNGVAQQVAKSGSAAGAIPVETNKHHTAGIPKTPEQTPLASRAAVIPVSPDGITNPVTAVKPPVTMASTPVEHRNGTGSNSSIAVPAAKKEHADGAIKTSQEQAKEQNSVVNTEPNPNLLIAKDNTPINQPGDTSQPKSKNPNTGKPIAQANDSMNGLPSASVNTPNTPARFSISIMAGVHQSNMRLVAPSGMQANKALRKQVESPELDFTGGYLVDYKINEQVLLSAGIIMSAFSMRMNYDATASGRSPELQPGSTYKHRTDTITAGNVLSDRIKYSWTEIPLFVTYRFKTKKRVGIEVRGGISYAIIGTVDASMVGQDNIGVLVMKTKESFPVFQNSVFAHLYAGISYQLNETVSLNAMPYFKYSLNSMVKNDSWVQQYPWMTGMSLGLRKSF